MKFFANMKGWQKLVVFLVVLLIVVRIAHPPTAEWILAPIMELSRAAIDIARNTLGGTP